MLSSDPVNIHSAPSKSSNKKIKGFIHVGLLIILLIVVVSVVFILLQSKKISIKPFSKPESQNKELIHPQARMQSFKSNNGTTFSIPDSWFVHVNKNTKDKLSVEISDWDKWYSGKNSSVKIPTLFVQVKIETYLAENMDIESFMKKNVSLFSEIKKEEKVKLGDFNYLKYRGYERFSENALEFMTLGVKNGGSFIVIKATSPSIMRYEQQIEEIAKTVQGSKLSLINRLTKVLGDSTTKLVPTSLGEFDFTDLQVMGDKKDDLFTNKEAKYNNLPTKGYVFEAFPGQRLTTVTDELSQGSFITSYLFDEQGRLLKGPQDTRIEFSPTYAGKYYLLISNERTEALPFKIWVEDRNQTDFVVKVRDYHSGAEVFFPHEEGLRYVPFDKFSFVIDYNGVANPTAKVPQVYFLPGSINDFNSKAFFPEDKEVNKVSTSYYLMDPETVSVYPVNEKGRITTFPDNSQLATIIPLTETAKYIDRVFTNFSQVNISYTPSYEGLVPLTGEQKTLVIMYNFQNFPNTKPYTREQIYDLIMAEQDSVNDYFRINSNNKTWFNTTVVGWYTLPFDDSQGCLSYDTEAKSYAKEQGVDVDSFERIIFFSTDKDCGNGGGAGMGGNPAIVHINNTISLYVLAHELGHTFTLGHSHRLNCGQKAVAPYIECTQVNYGDSYSLMGGWQFRGNLRGFHLLSLGWLPTTKVQEIKQSGRYTLNVLNTNSSGIELYRIKKQDTNEYYYLEYRKPINYDKDWPSQTTEGIHTYIGYYIPYYIWPNMYLAPETLLVNTTPETPYDTDYPLADSRNFFDETNKIKITQVSHNSNTATFDVEFSQ